LLRAAGWALLAACLTSLAWGQEAPEPVDRSFYFIERSTEATELFNAKRVQEALAIFQELAANYADLDDEGYAALGVGDCLLGLGDVEAARAAYVQAKSTRPNLQAVVDERLIELELKGEVGEELIARLRAMVQSPDTDRHAVQWRLGRALQKRAVSLVQEAARAFRAAAEAQTPGCTPSARISWLAGHAVILDELGQDLLKIVDQVERSLELHTRDSRGAAGEQTQEWVLEREKSEYLVRTRDGGRLEFQVRQEAGSCEFQVQVNGKPLELTAEESRSLQRYQDRINELLNKAASRAKQ
jgi:tetratricopeptide (TPR) repeat protein